MRLAILALALLVFSMGCSTSPTPTLVTKTPTRIATQQAAPTRPASANDSYPCLAGQIKASRETMIYHAPGQQDYARTVNRVQCFVTEAQAEAAGYGKAQR